MMSSLDTVRNELVFCDCDVLHRRILAMTESLRGWPNAEFGEKMEAEIRNLFFEVESIGVESENEAFIRALGPLYYGFLLAIGKAKTEGKTYPVMRAFLWQLDERIVLLKRRAS